jgi:hypothetical protein
MSGVIDDNGQQWEHCNSCGEFKRFPENLGYEPPTPQYQYGRMLCIKCANTSPNLELIEPAPSWTANYS